MLTLRLRGVALMAGVAVVALDSSIAMAETARLVQTDDPYFQQGQEALQRMLALQPNTNQAKNVILFVADGMSIATITAGRIFEGQQRGIDGESNSLVFETFPHAALVKTYAHDAQVSDSAPTAVAMVTGVKTINDIIGLNSSVPLEDCEASKGGHVTTLLEMAESIGMSTGVVTTARVTHATPAAQYAHIGSRDWEDDNDMPEEAKAAGCTDIAAQLIDFPYGDGIEVAMGGGRHSFLPANVEDPEDAGQTGERQDGRNLAEEWVSKHNDGTWIWNLEQFEALDPASDGHVLGLFNRSHMQYEADRANDAGGEPSLSQMTGFAIEALSDNPEGFFLMVESGRVDHAHHATNAYRSLTDLVEFDNAIKTALEMVDTNDTLVVVTADHSHTMTIAGYPKRGNPILGLARGVDDELIMGADNKPYTTLSYANGPGGWAIEGAKDLERPDPSKVDTTDVDYLQQATVPLESETHGGDDVAVFAIGPFAHLFQGVVEQHYIFHVMDHASKISERAAATDRAEAQ